MHPYNRSTEKKNFARTGIFIFLTFIVLVPLNAMKTLGNVLLGNIAYGFELVEVVGLVIEGMMSNTDTV